MNLHQQPGKAIKSKNINIWTQKIKMLNTDKKILITDTSVLINFLNINRLDLLLLFLGKFLIKNRLAK